MATTTRAVTRSQVLNPYNRTGAQLRRLQPAPLTGVVVKPAFGLVPRTGVIPNCLYLNTHGPLARTVAAAARLLAVIAEPNPSNPLALERAWDADWLVALRDDALGALFRAEVKVSSDDLSRLDGRCCFNLQGRTVRRQHHPKTPGSLFHDLSSRG